MLAGNTSLLGASWEPIGSLLGASWRHFVIVLDLFGGRKESSMRFAEILKNLQKHCKVL